MTFPSFFAGQVLTPDDLDAIVGLDLVALKGTSQSRTSTTTVADDDELFLVLAADATYHVEANIRVAGPADGDFQMRWTVPSGASMVLRLCYGPHEGETDAANVDAAVMVHRALTTEQHYGVPTSGNCAITERLVVVTGGSVGELRMQWAQATSNGSPTTVGAGSILRARRVS